MTEGGIATVVVTDSYVDRKRWAWALSSIWLGLPLLGIALVSATGAGAWNWLTLVVWYGVLPVVDRIVGSDSNNPPEAAVARLERDAYYRILTYITVPVH